MSVVFLSLDAVAFLVTLAQMPKWPLTSFLQALGSTTKCSRPLWRWPKRLKRSSCLVPRHHIVFTFTFFPGLLTDALHQTGG
jgi:hypothetical protein